MGYHHSRPVFYCCPRGWTLREYLVQILLALEWNFEARAAQLGRVYNLQQLHVLFQ